MTTCPADLLKAWQRCAVQPSPTLHGIHSSIVGLSIMEVQWDDAVGENNACNPCAQLHHGPPCFYTAASCEHHYQTLVDRTNASETRNDDTPQDTSFWDSGVAHEEVNHAELFFPWTVMDASHRSALIRTVDDADLVLTELRKEADRLAEAADEDEDGDDALLYDCY